VVPPVVLVPPVPPLVLMLVPPAVAAKLTAGCKWNEYVPCSAPLNVALLVLPAAPENCACAIVLNDSAATITATTASTLLVTLSTISIPPEVLEIREGITGLDDRLQKVGGKVPPRNH